METKKAYKKVKRKILRPWKGMTFLSGILSVILILLVIITTVFDNTIALFMGDTFWEVENADASAQYYASDFDSLEECIAYGRDLCQEIETEGAVLLMNENNALPLENGAKVSCFSGSSVNLVYGGAGSGNVDVTNAPNLKEALEKSGFQVNETLWDFYETGVGSEYARDGGGMVSLTSPVTSEVPWSVYTDEVKSSVASYGDAAIVVLSRTGGEGSDLEYQEVNYLALDENEKEMLSQVAQMKADGTVSKIIVLINTSNALQVDFLKDNTYDIDACLWIGGVGITGAYAVGEILAGTVNPSGSLVDTYCYDNYSSPAMQNFTPMTYLGDDSQIPSHATMHLVYQEGIYVGYKYYETRYEDYVMSTGNAGDYTYGDTVAFPFGYGLSYTQFAYSDMQTIYLADSDQYEITVTVTNVGDTYSGKETVQVYAQTPYTKYDKENSVEKSAVQLCGFTKTDILAPGESQTVKVLVEKRDLASYDAYGAGTYILDVGAYYLTVATDAHDAVNNILTAKGYDATNTDGKMDAAGNTALVYNWNEENFDATTYATSANGTVIENQLSDSDINLYEGTEEKIVYLSRSDWEGTFPTGSVQFTLTEQMTEDLQDVQYDATDYETCDMPTLGADNGLKLYDMIGLDYDDPQWEALLDQLTFDEMVSLIGDSYHWTMPIESVSAPGTRDENGPQGLTATLFKTSVSDGETAFDATAFTSEDVMAATFNEELLYEAGKVIGNDCLNAGVAFLYGTGNNIHRTPYSGRNFEYYSEDGYLSGKMCAQEVAGMKEKGVEVLMKHFALNDSENERIGLGVWANEQSIREIYLKAFQTPVEEADANGVMVAYVRFGCQWAGAVEGLMNGILRGEWGSNGMSTTDSILKNHMNGVDGVMAGTSTFDAMLTMVRTQLPKYEDDPVIVTAMREACHHNLYAIANSAAMNGMGADSTIKNITPSTIILVRVLMVVCLAWFALSLVMWIRKAKVLRETQEYKDYMELRK